MRESVCLLVLAVIDLASPMARPGESMALRADAGRSVTAVQAPSRWLPGAREYKLDAEYGREPDDWLEGVAAVSVSRTGEVFVYDAAAPRVVVLGPDLAYRREFGRRGRGPGELLPMFIYRNVPPPPTAIMTVADDIVAVYDAAQIVHLFGLDGSFREYAPGVPRTILFMTMQGVYKTDAGILYAVDTWLDETRALEIWLAGREGSERVFALPLPRLETRFMAAREARPQWAVHGEQVFVADGHSDRIVRYSLATGGVDTIPLPDLGQTDNVTSAANYPRLPGGQRRPDPSVASIWRWQRMSVDPDGHVWIFPTAYGRRPEGPGFQGLVVNPATGRAELVTVPAMPRAFGPPGVYYTAEVERQTDVHFIQRYSLR